MFSNGVVGFLDPLDVPGTGIVYDGLCCDGQDLSSFTGVRFNYTIMPWNTDLIDTGIGKFYTQGDSTFQKYMWENLSEYYDRNTSNTFDLTIYPMGNIAVNYEELQINNHAITVGVVGDLSAGEYEQWFYNHPTDGAVYWDSSEDLPVEIANGESICSVIPDSHITCLYYPQVYADNVYNQQCGLDALYDYGCPGWDNAYLDQQCSIDALYNESCDGWEDAYYEEYVEEAMKKEMAKKEMMMKAMKTGEADAEPNAEMLNAMVKDPHKSKEDKPMKDMNAMYMKSDVRADVKNGGGADMAKVKDAPKMQTAMKKINAMYKTEKYLDEKPGSIQNVVAQMQVNEMKTVTIRVKEFSQMVETYLARGGVKGFINAELTEGKQVLPLKEVRTFIDTYNKHFLTNYRAEEFIIRDRLSEAVTGLPKGRALMYIIKTDKNTASRIKSFLADHGERYPIHIDDDDSGQITLDAYDDKDAAHDAAQAISKKFNVTVRGTR